MAFPAENLLTELFIGGVWVDITSKVRGAGDITIVRGRSSQSGAVRPSSLTLTLNDRAVVQGTFNNRNPLSPYYGKLLRNTQIRQIIHPQLTSSIFADVSDNFTRSVSNGWGSTSSGFAWTTFSAGTSNVSDWNVNGSAATHYVDAANEIRYSVLLGLSLTDIDLAFTFTAPQATGATLEIGPVFRWTGTNSFDRPTVQLLTSNAVQLKGTTRAGLDIATAVGPVPGLVHTGTGQPLRMRVRTFGPTIRAKVWIAANAEPSEWHLTYVSSSTVETGAVGLRTFRNTGNTNTANPTATFDDFTVINEVVRFHGEVPSWRTSGDQTRTDVITKIEAAGVFRRLQAGARPLDSAVKRFVLSKRTTFLGAYWPFEDEAGSTQVASAVPSVLAIPFTAAMGTFAQDTATFAGSRPLPVLSGAGFTTTAINLPNTGLQAVGFLIKCPSTPLTDGAQIIDWRQSGSTSTVVRWELIYKTGGGGGLLLRGMNSANASVVATGTMAFGTLDGRGVKIAVNLTQNGANVDYAVFVTTATGSSQSVGSFAAVSLGRLDDMRVNGAGLSTGCTFGHLVVSNSSTSVSEFLSAPYGWVGENAATRVQRLCAESGITVQTLGVGERLGAQTQKSLVELLSDIESVDRGILYEPANSLGVGYICRSELLNRSVSATFPHSLLQIPLEPLDDDASILNRVTVRRDGGSSTTAEQLTGPMSTQDPPNGVGLYEGSYTVPTYNDASTDGVAGFLLALGTWDEPRYPGLQIQMAKRALDENRLYLATLPEGARFSITGLPPWMPPDPLDLMVRGSQEVFANSKSARGWEITYYASPYGPYGAALAATEGDLTDDFRVDVNERYSTTRQSTLNAGITSTATSLAIASTGFTWSTAAADMPIPVTIVSGNASQGERALLIAPGTVLNANPSFEVDASNWTPTGCTAVRSTSQAVGGSASLFVTPDGVTAATFVGSERVAASVGAVFRAAAWVMSGTGTTAIRIIIDWYTALSGGSYISSALGTLTALPGADWTLLSVTGTAPATTNAAMFRVAATGTPPSSEAYFMDVATLVNTSTVSSTSPQTFTVVRSINGVARAWSAGDQIFPTYPARATY